MKTTSKFFGIILFLFGMLCFSGCSSSDDDGDSYVEETLGALYLGADLRQVGDLQRCAVLFDDFHQRYVVEIQLAFLSAEFVLREVKSLVNQVVILILHCN